MADLKRAKNFKICSFLTEFFWDREIDGYRTEKENSALAVMRRITRLCKNEKEEKSVEISSLTKCAHERTRTFTSEDTRS